MRTKAIARVSLLWLLLAAACGAGNSQGRVIESDAACAPELPESVTVKIGEKGGELKAKGVTLKVPAGALTKEVSISATKVSASKETDATKAKLVSDVYQFGPEGTTFTKEVTISFKTDEANPKTKVYFTKQGSEEFEQIASETKDLETSAKVSHFSKGFAGIPAEDMDAGDLDGGVPSDDAAMAMTDAETVRTHVIVRSRDKNGYDVTQTWAAFQDGDGAFQPLPPPTLEGLYEFEVTSTRFGIALVCAPEGLRQSVSVAYTTTARPIFDLVMPDAAFCNKAPPVVRNATGNLVVPSSATYYRYGVPGSGDLSPIGGTGPLPFSVPGLPDLQVSDLLMGIASASDAGLMRVIFLRGLQPQGQDVTVQDAVDFTTTGYDVGSAALTLAGVNDPTQVTANVYYATNGAQMGMSLSQGAPFGAAPSVSMPFATITEDARLPSDRYVINASENLPNGATSALTYSTYASGNVTLTLPPAFAPKFSAGNTNPTVDFDEYAGATSYVFGWTIHETNDFEVTLDPAWIQTHGHQTLVFPDLTSVSGFDPSWGSPDLKTTHGRMQLAGEAHVDTSSAKGVLKTTATGLGSL